MKKTLTLATFVIFLFSLCCCSVAYDDSVHTTRLYFYNYTDKPFYVKLSPKNFKAKEKFRQHKTDFIYPATDDEAKTEPDITFSWIPGEFYYNYMKDKSMEYESNLQFYFDKRHFFSIENTIFFGIPSAEDFDGSYLVAKTFTKKEYLEEDFQKNLELITEEADKMTFSSVYEKNYDSERQNYYYVRANPFYDIFLNKDCVKDVEKVIEKYGLEKGPDVYIIFSNETRGPLKYELKDE